MDLKRTRNVEANQPEMSDYTNHLFHYMEVEKIATLSCGHVIPKTNLLVQPISKGVSGIEFDFTYAKRESESMVRTTSIHNITLFMYA